MFKRVCALRKRPVEVFQNVRAGMIACIDAVPAHTDQPIFASTAMVRLKPFIALLTAETTIFDINRGNLPCHLFGCVYALEVAVIRLNQHIHGVTLYQRVCLLTQMF